jgi:hypothetical protein
MEPLHLDFHGRLAVRIQIEDILHRPVRAVLAKTFAAFVRPDPSRASEVLDIRVGAFRPETGDRHLVDGCWQIGPGRIYRGYSHKIARWRAEISGLHAPETLLRVAGNPFSYLVFPFETIYQLILYKLGRAGLAFVHALGVVRNGEAKLLIGRSGIGKSSLGARFLRDGHRLLGDDTVLLDAGGRVYAFPIPIGLRAGTMRGYGVRMRASDYLVLFVTKSIKLASLGRINLFFKLPALRLGRDRLAESAPLGHAIFALPGPGVSLRPEPDREAFAERASRCARFESVLMEKLLDAYAYAHPAAGAESWRAGQKAVLQAAFGRGRLSLGSLPETITDETYSTLRSAMADA